MNAKQRRIQQRAYTAEFTPKLVELRLLGATPAMVGTWRTYTAWHKRNLPRLVQEFRERPL